MPSKILMSDDLVKNIWLLYDSGSNRKMIAKLLGITEWAIRKTIEGKCRPIGKSLSLWHEKNTVSISYEQEQVILGSLLGDASLVLSNSDQYEFQVGHCLEQKDWLSYKSKILDTNIRSYIKGAGSYSAGKEFFITSYHNKYELKRIYELCFNSKGIKTVSKKWAQKLDAQAIAVWFMDDGTSSFSNGAIIARFSTLSFSKKQLKILQSRLLEFRIETTLQKHSDGLGLIIAIRQKSINQFMDLIEPYIVDCMKYKIKRRMNEPNFTFSGKNIRSANSVL